MGEPGKIVPCNFIIMARNKHLFQFKQFAVRQEKSGMKICTDSTVFGAWCPMHNPARILDIGTGTGLLSLMLAQRCEAKITALEMENGAAEEARQNFADSPWANRLILIQSAVQDFKSTEKFDLIISNPPFYDNHWPRKDKNKHLAMHADQLPPADLISAVKQHLAPSGYFALLLPPWPFERYTELLQKEGLSLSEQTLLFDRPQTDCIRKMGLFTYQKPKAPSSSHIFVRDEKGAFDESYQHLMQSFLTIF